MSDTTVLLTTPDLTTTTPRARRGAVAVIAQYIQDLTHPSPSDACAAAA